MKLHNLLSKTSFNQTTLVYSFTGMYFSGSRVMFDMYFVFYVTTFMGLSLRWAGAVYVASEIARAFASLLYAQRSDFSYSSQGRRAWAFKLAAPLTLIVLLAMWWPQHKFGYSEYYYGTLAVMYGFTYGLVLPAYMALHPQLSSDYHDRTVISLLRHVFQMVALVMCALMASLVFTHSGYYAGMLHHGFVIVSALLFSLPFLWLAKVCAPFDQPLVAPQNKPKHWRAYFLVFKQPMVFPFVLMYGFFQSIVLFLPMFLPFYVKQYLQAIELFPLMLVALLLGAVLAFWYLGKVKKTAGKIKMWLIGLLVCMLATLLFAVVSRQTPLLITVVCFLYGVGAVIASVNLQSMLADICDDQHNIQAIYFTVINLLVRFVCVMVVSMVIGLVDYFSLIETGFFKADNSVYLAYLLAAASSVCLMLSLMASWWLHQLGFEQRYRNLNNV